MKWRRTPRQKRAVVALGDTHAGHKLGLCHPGVALVRVDDDGDVELFTPELTATQEYLWGLYQGHQEVALEFIGGPADLLIHGGDATHGLKYSGGLMDGITDGGSEDGTSGGSAGREGPTALITSGIFVVHWRLKKAAPAYPIRRGI